MPTDLTNVDAMDTERRNSVPNHGRRLATLPSNINSLAAVPSPTNVRSQSPITWGPLPRPDRLSFRLRSNSGLSLHTDENALSQYTDYGLYGADRPTSCEPSLSHKPPNDDYFNFQNKSPAPAHEPERWSGSRALALSTSLDLLGTDTLLLALETPAVRSCLARYCRERGCEDELEFLSKVDDYIQATDALASTLTAISTSFIAPGSIHSLNLPPRLVRSMTSDVKRIAHTTIPTLEAVFAESRAHTEQRLTKEIFPEFVKTQLALYTATALSSSPRELPSKKLEFPGLAESFCLTDASNAIIGVSDAFLLVTGYTLQDVISQPCKLPQGSQCPSNSGNGTREPPGVGLASVELAPDYRKDGTPFWKLISSSSMKSHTGQSSLQLRYLMDASDCIESRKDLLRILGGDCDLGSESGQNLDVELPLSGRRTPLTPFGEEVLGSDISIYSRESSFGSPASSRMFQSLWKPARTDSPSFMRGSPSFPSEESQILSRADRLPNQRFHPRLADTRMNMPMNSCHILLRCHPICSSPAWNRAPSPMPSKRKHSLKLRVCHFSEEFNDLLSVRGNTSHTDIFHVLAKEANSPSMTKPLKSMIRDRVECGKSTSVDIVIDTDSRFAVRMGSARPSSGDSFSLKSESKIKFEMKPAKSSRQAKVMSHWTPLRNAEGEFEWVMLLLAP
ncbi:hypothetical protein F4780DRAFT_683006 [Xylariomycetidae sp. FL0641]|nr:hypothetical protein F4780DRAFT_683006 [Xylariomycetidae sp. FL0641]